MNEIAKDRFGEWNLLILENIHQLINSLQPVQLFVPSSSNPNVLKLNKGGLNAVLGHAAIVNRKVGKFCKIDFFSSSSPTLI